MFSICMLFGVSLTSAVSAGVIMASIPAVVAIGSWMFLRERITARVAATSASTRSSSPPNPPPRDSSRQQFRDPRFTQSVREAIALTGIDPRRIVLEITESLLMHDPAQAKVLLEELTELGIRFAIDDFGTGYSSLAYLQRFPLAKLKIDRSFVENLLTSRNDRAIVSAVVGLAQTLDLELVAEGVETEAQRELLTEMGCNHIQGWLVCQALPSEELARRFEAQQLRLHAA